MNEYLEIQKEQELIEQAERDTFRELNGFSDQEDELINWKHGKIDCPDCNGYGGDTSMFDIHECIECPTCDGTGKVEKGTKGWIQRLAESKV